MTDDKLITELTQPVQVTVIGTGDGTDVKQGAVGVTSGQQPNLIAIVVTPVVALAVRFVHAYLTGLLGLLGTVPMFGQEMMPWNDFADLLGKSATLALAGPVIALGKDLVTIFGKLEGKYPLWTGGV